MKKIIIILSAICILGVTLVGCTGKEESVGGITAGKKISEFSAKTINGEKVTQDIFNKYEITMINIWGIHCNPCVGELPEVGKLYVNKPEGTNIISICVDITGDKEIANAKDVLSSINSTMITIMPDEKLTSSLLSKILATPTTIFVDKNGTIVGDPICGIRDGQVYMDELKKRLNQVKKGD